MSLLSNKVAIITGASSGIGRASAILFAREGASVVVGARRQPELDLLVEEIRHEGGQAASLAGDVKSESYARALVDLALTRFGGLDIAFNNAGTTGTPGSVEELELTQWQETLDTNLTSAFMGAKYQIPAMQAHGGGSLIFTSTFVGHTLGLPGMAAYAASKAGLIGLTRVLAAEYGAQGVRVNALLPGAPIPPWDGPLPIRQRASPLCRICMPSNGWPNRRRSPVRPSISRPMHPALPPVLPCWPMVGYQFVAHDVAAPNTLRPPPYRESALCLITPASPMPSVLSQVRWSASPLWTR